MITRLKRTDGGGHRAALKWTRHAVRYAGGYSAVCGVATMLGVDSTEDSNSAQGHIHNCKRCKALTAEWVWKDKEER